MCGSFWNWSVKIYGNNDCKASSAPRTDTNTATTHNAALHIIIINIIMRIHNNNASHESNAIFYTNSDKHDFVNIL